MPTDLERFANRQVAAMLAIGINAIDAHKAVRDFLALLPPGADPDTYVIPAHQLEQDISDPQYAADALADWVGRDDIPASVKLILAAGEGE